VRPIAVIAHQKKSLGGGLDELRRVLADRGYPEPMWFEASSSRKAAPLVQRAVKQGAKTLFIWGGDGTVQRSINALGSKRVDIALLPAGTANLLATNLGIPIDLERAVDVGLGGARRRLDVGVLNGKRFAVMAGVGFDALAMRDADGHLKDHLGRLAYVVTGTRATHMKTRTVTITVDQRPWYHGDATCVLLGQMSSLGAGIHVFPDSRPDDGLLEIGVVSAETALQWARVLARLVVGQAQSSPMTEMTQGRRVDVRLSRPTVYELDGGARKAVTRIRARIEPSAITVCVPEAEQ